MRQAVVINYAASSIAIISSFFSPISAAPGVLNERAEDTKPVFTWIGGGEGIPATEMVNPLPTDAPDPEPTKRAHSLKPVFPWIGGGEGIPATELVNPLPTDAPDLDKRAPKAVYNGQLFTIHLQNTAGDSMQMNLKHDQNFPGAVCCPYNGPLPSSTQITYPTGWAGRISIGPVADEDVITSGSTIEASFLRGETFIAVSYVSGYTYPIVCSCNGQVTTGCNLPLLAHAAEDGGCPTPGSKICYNPDRTSDKPKGSPALPFFEPCQGCAYTYPNDHDANQPCPYNEAFCCVGILCPRNPRQHKGKRDLEYALDNGTVPAYSS